MAVIISKKIVVPPPNGKLLSDYAEGEIVKIPENGKLLSDYAEGEIVKIPENGTPVEFYVAKHDYESGLNGNGRTLVLRKDCHSRIQWHTSNINKYESSNINSWLNSAYKNVLSEKVKQLVETTKFYYSPSDGTPETNILERSIFLLSGSEFGMEASSLNKEGTTLPTASNYRISKANGSPVDYWTRSPDLSTTIYTYFMTDDGYISSCPSSFPQYCRPAFTLPSTTLFDPDTNIIKG